MGLLRLGFNVGYTLATAVGRFSGWRYDLPADWVPYFYFAVGFVELLGLVAGSLGAPSARSLLMLSQSDGAPLRGLVPVGLLFAFLGALPCIVASFVQPQFADQTCAGLLPRLEAIWGAPERSRMEAFLADPGAVVMNGRLLYPRFFSRDTGISSATPSAAFAPRISPSGLPRPQPVTDAGTFPHA